jgi:hypothetical protein
MNDDNWISPDSCIDPDCFNRIVPIKTKMGSTTDAKLTVEKHGNGQYRVLASYNFNPFPGEVDLRKFYLTQTQVDDLKDNGPKCNLVAPTH